MSFNEFVPPKPSRKVLEHILKVAGRIINAHEEGEPIDANDAAELAWFVVDSKIECED